MSTKQHPWRGFHRDGLVDIPDDRNLLSTLRKGRQIPPPSRLATRGRRRRAAMGPESSDWRLSASSPLFWTSTSSSCHAPTPTLWVIPLLQQARAHTPNLHSPDTTCSGRPRIVLERIPNRRGTASGEPVFRHHRHIGPAWIQCPTHREAGVCRHLHLPACIPHHIAGHCTDGDPR